MVLVKSSFVYWNEMMTMMTMMVEDHHDHVEDEDLHHQPPVVCKDQLQIIKGKRSKRPRQPSPFSLAMGSSTTTTTSDDSRGFVGSPSTSFELSGSTEEDQDMANCLILLAQGDRTTKSPPPRPVSVETRTTYVHQCKTCNRCFPSFQALGGHRASHKKPKVVNDEEINKGLMFVKEDVHHQQPFNNMNTTLSLQVTNKSVLGHNNKVPKVHECSMCGAEFSSGQALGGHMRRHRTLTNVATTTTTTTTTMSVGTKIVKPESEDKSKKQRTVLQLDLNLPAPEDHDHQRETKFSFASKQEKLLLFSTSSLVDCHY